MPAPPHISVERKPISLTQALQGGASASRIAASGREDNRPACRDEDGLAPCLTPRRRSGIFGVRPTPHYNQSKGTSRKCKYWVAGSSPLEQHPCKPRLPAFGLVARSAKCLFRNG